MWKVRVAGSIVGSKVSRPITQVLSNFPSVPNGAEAINSTFCSYFSESQYIHLTAETDLEDWDVEISTTEVERMLQRLNPRKATGSDLISTLVYKAASAVLAGPLTHIFNFFIRLRRFPNKWKFSHVVPLSKSCKPDINNLRPISLLPIPS